MFQRKTQPTISPSLASTGSEPRAAAGVPSIISADMTIHGDFTSHGDLQVEGQVFGKIEVSHLVIAKTGKVDGAILAKAVGISGTLKGAVKAGAVSLSSTARVEGDIVYETLAIESGAQLEGQCKRATASQPELVVSNA
jgi:cytoskeletal protein CcmA (bactofilin family)